jgi:monoterpene epsilon-lactone hydrolase
MLMQAGGDEILLNDTLHVAKKAEEAGVSVQQTVYPGYAFSFTDCYFTESIVKLTLLL